MNDQYSSEQLGKVLLIGVTGGTGHQAVRGLQARGVKQLVAMTRDASKPSSSNLKNCGVELITGDLDDGESLVAAMAGVNAIYLHALSHDAATADPLEVERGKNVINAALKADIKHLVYNSADGCDRNTGVYHMDNLATVEGLLNRAGVPNTSLRATLFMEEWFKHYTRPAILQGTFSVSHAPDFVQQYISVRDMGFVAGQALLNPDSYIGRKIPLAGDELSSVDMATAFANAQGSPVTFAPLPLDVFRNAPGMEQMVALVEWYERDGYHADVAAAHSEFPGIWTMAAFLEHTRWGDAGISYESFSDGSFQ